MFYSRNFFHDEINSLRFWNIDDRLKNYGLQMWYVD